MAAWSKPALVWAPAWALAAGMLSSKNRNINVNVNISASVHILLYTEFSLVGFIMMATLGWAETSEQKSPLATRAAKN